MKSRKAKKAVNIIVLLLLLISIFLAVYFYYCPADYVKTSDGEIYLIDGKPYIYYTDMFGNTFNYYKGIRMFETVPDYIVE